MTRKTGRTGARGGDREPGSPWDRGPLGVLGVAVLGVACMLAAGSSGCGGDEGPGPGDPDGTIADGEVSTPDGVGDVRDTRDTSEEVDILYPGNLCQEDDQCATGLCYGVATSQGFFEPAKCQTRCLDLFDYTRYCNSQADCCKGRCCIGCGGREGLCILE